MFLDDKGFVVDAVDISTVATNHLAGRHPNINVVCQDLGTWEVPKNRYEVIVNVRFLDRLSDVRISPRKPVNPSCLRAGRFKLSAACSGK